ncbi:hypothetical protein Gpo141_00004606 [Globisporangium polare]
MPAADPRVLIPGVNGRVGRAVAVASDNTNRRISNPAIVFSITGAYVICTDATANDITPADGADFYALVVLNLIVCVFAALSTLLLLMKLYAVCATSAIHAREARRVYC